MRGSSSFARLLSGLAASTSSRIQDFAQASRAATLLETCMRPVESSFSWTGARGVFAVASPPGGYTPAGLDSIQPRTKRQQVRSCFKLDLLASIISRLLMPVLTAQVHRVGRGPGSGSRLAGRGFKGQKARGCESATAWQQGHSHTELMDPAAPPCSRSPAVRGRQHPLRREDPRRGLYERGQAGAAGMPLGPGRRGG